MLNLLPRYLILRLENIYIQQDKFTLSSVDIIASDNIYIYIYIILLLIFFKRKKLKNKILAVNQNPKELTNLTLVPKFPNWYLNFQPTWTTTLASSNKVHDQYNLGNN